MLNNVEIDYLRDLAKKVKDLSLTAEKTNVIERYKSNNSLRRAKPTVVIYPGKEAQQEYMRDDEIRIEDEIFRDIEFNLKWKMCKAAKLPDDTPVTDIIYTGFSSHVTDWMDGYKTVRIGENLESSHFEPCIIDYDDIKKMRQPELLALIPTLVFVVNTTQDFPPISGNYEPQSFVKPPGYANIGILKSGF